MCRALQDLAVEMMSIVVVVAVLHSAKP
jgi:hypothetical protein